MVKLMMNEAESSTVTPRGVITSPYEVKDQRRAVTISLNNYEAAVKGGDRVTIEETRGEVLHLLAKYVADDCSREAHPEWSEASLKGTVWTVLGQLELATSFQTRALMLAQGADERGISAHNLSDTLRRRGYPELAVDWAKEAVVCDPRNLARASNLALALLQCGRVEEGREVLRTAMERSDLSDRHDALRIHVTYDEEYELFRERIPEVREIFSGIEGE